MPDEETGLPDENDPIPEEEIIAYARDKFLDWNGTVSTDERRWITKSIINSRKKAIQKAGYKTVRFKVPPEVYDHLRAVSEDRRGQAHPMKAAKDIVLQAYMLNAAPENGPDADALTFLWGMTDDTDGVAPEATLRQGLMLRYKWTWKEADDCLRRLWRDGWVLLLSREEDPQNQRLTRVSRSRQMATMF